MRKQFQSVQKQTQKYFDHKYLKKEKEKVILRIFNCKVLFDDARREMNPHKFFNLHTFLKP